MRKTRLMLFALVASFALAIGGSALAHPPGGSEDGNNNVSCTGTGVPGTGITVGAHNHGVGACNDSAPLIEGRIIVHTDGWVAADGDRTNPEPLNGFIRVGTQPGCGGGGSGQDSKDGGDPGQCG